MTNQRQTPLPQEQMGPAEKLLDLVLNASAHLWHNRPGRDIGGVWHPAKGRNADRGTPVQPGLFVPAAETLYGQLLEIFGLNTELMAHFASYALTETDWRDLKVATSALMLVQPHSGQPIKDDDGSVGFYDDDLRGIGEAMLLKYERKSARMMTPKAVLRVAELLETPAIAELNRMAGFADPASNKAPLGRWPKAATKWLRYREQNAPLLEGLVRAGYKETIKKIARKVGYKPLSERFFAVLGWKQSQSSEGHRTMGLDGLELEKRERFDDVSEAEICEAIVTQRLTYKEVMGRLPPDIGLTPAIMVALLPTLSDRDLRQLTPTLEELGLMAEPEIRDAWEKAIESATDQRGLNIARNVRSAELKERLAASADNAAKAAVAEATGERDVHVMFLIDTSGSMQGAIEKSVDALTKIVAGFPLDKLHIATFDTFGTTKVPKAASGAAIKHMLQGVKASGGTLHSAGVAALARDGVTVPSDATLLVIVVGDEAGEAGARFASSFADNGFAPSAFALILNVAYSRGETVRTAATNLGLPFSTITVDQFDDPYQVPRVLKTILEAPVATGGPVKRFSWVDKVMATKLLELPA